MHISSSMCVHQRSDAVQARYGSPIVCLDLVKAIEKHPREIALRSEFDTAISYINQAVRAGMIL